MCGICGILLPDRENNVDAKILKSMTDCLRHRGPDDEGYLLSGNLGMGVRRLSIIDRVGGNQPIFNEDKSVVITFNGEIYNYQDLRRELIKLGHRFYTHSDTEVIVHAYEQWGKGALNKLNGMFAFSIWDTRKRTLFLARDRMGKKPLYWHHSENGFIWASELKALVTVPWFRKEINLEAVHHYLTLQYIPAPLTIYSTANKLPAAHCMVVSDGSPPAIERWWQEQFEPKLKLHEEEAFEQARYLLDKAVERRLIAEVPLGVFLSGGIDSSIIVALMSKHSKKPVKTFTINFDDKCASEGKYARQVSNAFQTEHHEYLFRATDLAQLADDVIEHMDEPLADPAVLPLFALSKHAHNEVTVALCGDGGDETLAGYPRYARDEVLRKMMILPKTWPGWLLQTLAHAAGYVLPHLGAHGAADQCQRLSQLMQITPKASLVRWDIYFSEEQKHRLYSESWPETLYLQPTYDWISQLYDQATACHPLDRSLYADHLTYLAGNLLPKTDCMTMAHSLEIRSPFLDDEWVQWTAMLPVRYKLLGLQTKWLLKHAFDGFLPKEILQRKKQGFSVPMGQWLRKDLWDWARECIGGSVAMDDYFVRSEVIEILDAHKDGRAEHGKRLWALLVLNRWLEC